MVLRNIMTINVQVNQIVSNLVTAIASEEFHWVSGPLAPYNIYRERQTHVLLPSTIIVELCGSPHSIHYNVSFTFVATCSDLNCYEMNLKEKCCFVNFCFHFALKVYYYDFILFFSIC